MINNEIKIENSYDTLTFIEPNGNVIKEKSVEDLLTVIEPKLDSYHNPKVNVTTYASGDVTMSDAMDLTMLAALCCWDEICIVETTLKLQLLLNIVPKINKS